MASDRLPSAGAPPLQERGHQGGHHRGGGDGGVAPGPLPPATSSAVMAASVAAVLDRTAAARLGVAAAIATRSRTGSSSVIGTPRQAARMPWTARVSGGRSVGWSPIALAISGSYGSSTHQLTPWTRSAGRKSSR